MPQGCGWDLLIFGTNLDGSGVDVAVPLPLGEDVFAGTPGTTTKIKPREAGHITGITAQSEDGALVDYGVGIVGSEDYQSGALFQSAQTEGGPLNRLWARCMVKVEAGDLIRARLTNAAQKMDAIGILLGKGGVKPKISSEPFGELPEGAVWVECTTGHTSTADTLVKGAITFVDKVLGTGKKYKILAAVWEGATLEFWRLRAKSGIDMANMPGGIGGDSDQINAPVYFSHAPIFHADDGVQLETLCTAGDTAAVGMMLLVEV